MTLPNVSVILSVKNGEAYLGQALSSVFRQTFTDFELVVVDDGSTDRTPEILGSISDPRLTVITQSNVGLTVSLNRALARSRGDLIARMDADDVAHPERFAWQIAYLDAHPEVGLLGTACQEITPEGRVVTTVVPPANDAQIRRALIHRNPFIHSSIMARRGVIERAGRYDERLEVAQDYDLWLRMSRLTRMANLARPLVQRRLTPGRVSSRDTERLRAELRVKWRALRSRTYPFWCAVFLAKPLCALALPHRLRPLMRRATGGTLQP